MMRRISSIIPLLCIVALILISGCAKTGPELFKGNYSFKTSGYVTAACDSSCRYDTTITKRRQIDTLDVIYDTTWRDPLTKKVIERIDTSYNVIIKTYNDTTIVENADTITVDVVTETGQMDITEVDPDNGRVVITMNTVGGDIIVYYANATDNRIVLEPKKRHYGPVSTSLISIVSPKKGEYTLSELESSFVVTGEGTKYDNIILFKFDYKGYIKIGSTTYDIVSSDIDCRAKLN